MAIAEYKKVLVLFPKDVGAHTNLGIAYKRMGRMQEAERYLGKAVEMERGGGGAANNLAQLLLLQGKFTQGWQAYRWRIAGGMDDKTAVLPSIDGMAGKILHVRHEQGLGDEIFFLRFLPQVMARGITVRYLPQKKIASILRRTDLIGATVVEKFPDEPAVFCLNCGDLPLLLGHGDSDPLPPSLTVRPLAHKLEQARRILAAAPGPHIGVAWRGGRADVEALLFKQASLDDLAAALHCYPGAIVILQRHPEPGEVARFQALIGRPVIDASGCNDDLELMLALVDLLDDMAGVSNTNVHLRAMRGRESEVLIPNPPDFRWFDKGAVSPWFPLMRLYRQGYEGEWAFALTEMKAALIQRRGRRNEEAGLTGDSDIEPVRDEMRAGRFAEALTMCQTLIKQYPGHPHLEMMIGTCLMKLERAREAIEHFQYAIVRQDKYIDALVNCGVAYQKINKLTTSIKYYIESIRLSPDLYQIYTNIGVVYQKMFDYDQAIVAHRRAIASDPDYADGQNNLASLLLCLERYDEAVEPLRHLTRLEPERPDHWEKLALALCETEAVDAALAALSQARRLWSGRIDNDILEGYILMSARREVDAERIFRDILARHPSQTSAKVYLLELLLQSGNDQGEADALLRSVWPSRDQAGRAWRNLFNLLLAHDHLSEAETLVREEMRKGGAHWQSPMAYLASVYLAAGKFEKADRLYADILTRDPANRTIQSTQALSYLTVGQWEKGWTRYLDRVAVGDALSFISRDPLPADLSGLRILLGREQGIGDELFFLRYAGELKRRGAWLGYVASPKMLALTSRLPFLDRAASSGREIPGCDRRIAIGDLPWLLRQFDEASLPPSLLLPACPDKLETMRAILAAAGPPPYIGVSWQAGLRSRRTLYKEIPRRPFAKALRGLPGTIVCLQRLATDHEMASFTEALGRAPARIPGIDDDLEATLALMVLLDELVGVSSTNIHLRALTGKPARVLVPYPPDFRWMSRQGKSPWFPEMETYRQKIGSSWDDVFDRLRGDLERLYPA